VSIPTLLAVVSLVAVVPLNWFVTVKLWRLSIASPDIHVLRERAVVAAAWSVVLTLFALIFLNNDLTPPVLDFDDTKFLTRSVLLVAGLLSSVLWLRLSR
jgi:hypothetical protein